MVTTKSSDRDRSLIFHDRYIPIIKPFIIDRV